MTTLAVVRPEEWELPLFLHVLGAMALLGSVLYVFSSLVVAWRREDAEGASLVRAAYRALFLFALPSHVLMYVAGIWTASEEYPEGSEEPGWLGAGFGLADLSGLLLLVSLVLAGIGLKRGPGRRSTRVVTVLTGLMLAAYLVAIFLMTTKPG